MFAHLYSNLVGSRAAMQGGPESVSPAAAVGELLTPATDGAFGTPDDIPSRWRWLWTELSEACGVDEVTLLAEFRLVRVELGERIPSETDIPGRDGAAYRRDLRDVMGCLLRLATDPRRLTKIDKEVLVDHLGGAWRQRLDLRSMQEFPLPQHYEPVETTVAALGAALDEFTTGYIAVVGSAGSGKSTLLSRTLAGREDVVARYYAYVPGRLDIGGTSLEASTFLHDLVLNLERAGLPRGPVPVDFDVPSLTARLEAKLLQLGERFQESGDHAVIVIDGLDHVERERGVDGSLLRYLPRPEALPDGVTIVVGGQSVSMLHADIRTQLADVGRVISMAGLSRVSVGRLAEAWELQVDADRLWRVTHGHPLILTYLLQELRDLPDDQRAVWLAAAHEVGGDVAVLYGRLWAALENDHDVVGLAALACRVRTAIDFRWLQQHGQRPDVIRRLRERAAHLFRREGERWYFFHESFRLFLADRTARIAGQFEPDEDRRFHRELAAMCRTTDGPRPQAWELLYHLAAAQDHQGVLEAGTPEFFRVQYQHLRPVEAVGEDIRLAARSLAEHNDSMALVRLVIAAAEQNQRDILMPEREPFLRLLVLTNQVQTAIEYMETAAPQYGIDDDRTTRLRIARLLYRRGHFTDAARVFEANEPLELLHRPAELATARNPYQLLYAWTRAAVLIRGPYSVVNAVGALRLSQSSSADETDPTAAARRGMLGCAIDELDRAGREAEADDLLGHFDVSDPDDRAMWIRALSWRWAHQRDRAAATVTRITERFQPTDLDDEHRVLVGEGLWKAGLRDLARNWIAGLGQPPLPTDPRELWRDQEQLYRFNRLLAARGQTPDPEDLIITTIAHEWGYVHVARLVVAVAQLEGAAWAGGRLAGHQFIARVRPILQRIQTLSRTDHHTRYKIGQVRSHLLVQLVGAASAYGRDHVRALWDLYTQRWQDHRDLLRYEFVEVVPALAKTGFVTDAEIGHLLDRVDRMLADSPDDADQATMLVRLAALMHNLGRDNDTIRLLRRAVGEGLTVYHSKDLQLSAWIKLLGPRLDGPDGEHLSRWLAGTLPDLRERTEGAHDAASHLLVEDGRRRPGHAWSVGRWLEHHDVIDFGTRVECLLQAHAEEATGVIWWITLAEQAIPILSRPPVNLVTAAANIAVTVNGAAWLSHRLAALSERTQTACSTALRPAWQHMIADIAAHNAIPMTAVGLPDQLHPEFRPPRSRRRGTGEEEADQFLASHRTVQSIIEAARQGSAGEAWNTPWDEAVDLVAQRLSIDDIRQLDQLFPARSSTLSVRRRLARRAADLGAADVAHRIAESIIQASEPMSWPVHWDGGSLLAAFQTLYEMDPQPTRALAYRRLAADAASSRHILPQMIFDLNRYLDLFGIDDRDQLGSYVEQYLKVLLREPAQQPAVNPRDASLDAPATIAAAAGDLLASPHRLAVDAAQQTLLAALRTGDAHASTVLAGILDAADEELTFRALSVIDAAATSGTTVDQSVLQNLTGLLAHDNLALRLAARDLYQRHVGPLEERTERELPAVYRLALPPPPTLANAGGSQPVGRDDLDILLAKGETQLAGLARAAGVDLAVINARVAVIARSLAGNQQVSDKSDTAPYSRLGWSFQKPSIRLWEQAVARVAAELADARLLPADLAVFLSTGPGYDPTVIAAHPQPQPPQVRPVPEDSDAWTKPEDWIAGVRDVGHRLASNFPDGWKVIGEHTEIRRTEDKYPREVRIQGLGRRDRLSRDDLPSWYHRRQLRTLADTTMPPDPVILIQHQDWSYRGPNEWLGLHPHIGRLCGWHTGTQWPLDWYDAGSQPVVKTVWWRSGWRDSTGYTGRQDVAEGWLLLANQPALQRLTEILGGELAIAWRATRDLLAAQDLRNAVDGIRDL
ncbi:hypothetical protein Vlu01_00060 [Micromonospora lutea]|uniref:AAA+ ATPase domain-containing protein n=1 Tax=Micromonospora lutea TaxID=419825 RepID=A0ABQ4IN94_9ACTN|nr:hypothetical protein Vlu01_00060 [Micromonospora lutea]